MKALAAATAAAIVAAGVIAGTTGSAAGPVRPTAILQPVTGSTLVCPDVVGQPGLTTTTLAVGTVKPPQSVTLRSLPAVAGISGGAVAKPATSLRVDSGSRGVAVGATGSGASTIAADQLTLVSSGAHRALLAAACVPPAADWWFVGASGAVGAADSLYLTNPGSASTQVSIQLWQGQGLITPPGLPSLTVPAATRLIIPIARLAPGGVGVSLHIHALGGPVASALLDFRAVGPSPLGGDWIPASAAPSTQVVVPGLTGGAGSRLLVLTNPGSMPATVSLRLLTSTGSFVPAGQGSLPVPAGGSVLVPLSVQLGPAAGAVVATSSEPIVAGADVTLRNVGTLAELEWAAGTPALSGPAVIADPATDSSTRVQLHLAAVDVAATVRISDTHGHSVTVTVPAKHTAAYDLATVLHDAGSIGPVRVVPGTAPVQALVVIVESGAHGPLVAAEPLLVLPTARTVLPVVPAVGPAALPGQD